MLAHLEQHIQSKAKQGYGATVANAKQKEQKAKAKGQAADLKIEPHHLQLSPRSFNLLQKEVALSSSPLQRLLPRLEA